MSKVRPVKPAGKAATHGAAGRGRAAKSLRETYEDSCREHAAHPNSVLLKLLPDRQGVGLASDTLDLSRNYVGDRGVMPVLAVCQRSTQLKRLVLVENGLRNAGVINLCAVLAKHPSVTAVDLSSNYISQGAATALAQLLSENPRIVDLGIANTKFDVDARLRLKELTQHNANLRIAGGGAAAE